MMGYHEKCIRCGGDCCTEVGRGEVCRTCLKAELAAAREALLDIKAILWDGGPPCGCEGCRRAWAEASGIARAALNQGEHQGQEGEGTMFRNANYRAVQGNAFNGQVRKPEAEQQGLGSE